jgi:hypothetical protein
MKRYVLIGMFVLAAASVTRAESYKYSDPDHQFSVDVWRVNFRCWFWGDCSGPANTWITATVRESDSYGYDKATITVYLKETWVHPKTNVTMTDCKLWKTDGNPTKTNAIFEVDQAEITEVRVSLYKSEEVKSLKIEESTKQ